VRLALTWFAVAAMVAMAEGPLEVRPGGSRAPQDGPGDTSASVLRATVNWIRIPVHVTDESGAPYAGLARADFILAEDGVPQEVRRLAQEDGPASISIVFDASSSMKDKLGESRAALTALFQHALPGDEYSLIEFGNEPALRAGFTSEIADIERAAARIHLSTWTALYDAVYLGVAEARRSKNQRKAILLLSDGADNNSRYSESELRRYVRESDVAIYSIAIRGSSRHVAALKRLSDDTGGLSLEVQDMNGLSAAVSQLSRALRSHYVIEYVSNRNDPARDGLYRRVELRLTPAVAALKLRLAWRHGYYTLQNF